MSNAANIFLGRDRDTNAKTHLDSEQLRTHMHMIGATGAGKSTAILAMLRPLLWATGENKSCIFLIDPLGNLSNDILTFMAHPDYSTDQIRERLVYIEPARDDVVMPFNPLLHTSDSNRYYQTMRAVEIVLRAWDAQSLRTQPRLFQWLYKAFCAAAMMGLPISMCRYLVHPGTIEHDAILQRIPYELQNDWKQILKNPGRAMDLLDSTRNRLDPFFQSLSLKRMFSSRESRFDCERIIREKRIVVLNLASRGALPPFIANTIGAMALNEFIETASRLATTEGRHLVDPTYVFLDEFQHFVGPDLEEALPTMRQMGLRFILAHQSFSQLEREDVDLTRMIWQARSRLIFANNERDADMVADELAKLTFDPMAIKHKQTTLRQLNNGFRKEWLRSVGRSTSATHGSSESESSGKTEGDSRTDAAPLYGYSTDHEFQPTTTSSSGSQGGKSQGHSSSDTSSDSESESEANVPIFKTFREVSGVTFQSFEECSLGWGQAIRRLKAGQVYLQQPAKDEIRAIEIDYHEIPQTPALRAAVAKLKEDNFRSDFFISASEADKEAEDCRSLLLNSNSFVMPDQMGPQNTKGLSDKTSLPDSDGAPHNSGSPPAPDSPFDF